MTESKLVDKLKENQLKVEQADLDKITELRDNYKKQTVRIGQLNVERILMNQAVERLNDAIVSEEKAYTDLQEKERELVKNLQEKYGIGQLNLDNGTFTPVKSK
tara:strand:+ start:277 stop:588 length:312 start_codon:yes stop_codon:yes gene_type:complete